MIRTVGIDLGYAADNPSAIVALDSIPNPSPANFPRVVGSYEILPQPLPERLPSAISSGGWGDVLYSITHQIGLYFTYHLGLPPGRGRYGEFVYVGIEFPHAKTNRQVAIRLAVLWGMVAQELSTRACVVVDVQPSEAKKALSNNGRADADLMIACSHQMFGDQIGTGFSTHQAHAAGCAIAALQKRKARLNSA